MQLTTQLKQLLLILLATFAFACGVEPAPDSDSDSVQAFMDQLETETSAHALQVRCRGAGIRCCDVNGRNCVDGDPCSKDCSRNFPFGAYEAQCHDASCTTGASTGLPIAIDASCNCIDPS